MMTITDKQIRGLKARKKPYKSSDSGSLYLLIHPNGSKYWRFNFTADGKRKTLAIGVYPRVSLKDAREARDDAKKMLRRGIDPSSERKKSKRFSSADSKPTFATVSDEWIKVKSPNWRPSHLEKQRGLLRKNLLPQLGDLPIEQLTSQIILSALRLVEARGAYETTRRCKQIASQIFRFAIAVGYINYDPTYGLSEALIKPKTRHFSAIIDKLEFGQLIRAINGFTGSLPVEVALNLAPILFVRPGELRHMEWIELNFEEKLWKIPSEKMKMAESHIVPLSDQAIALIERMRPFSERLQYVFPGERSRKRPMSENALNAALRRLGYTKEQQTTHGFRASARTLLEEELREDVRYIEMQLAHEVRDHNGRAYNRTTHLEERIRMMQRWADFLDNLQRGASVFRISK